MFCFSFCSYLDMKSLLLHAQIQFLISTSKHKVCEKPVLIYISFASMYSFAKSFYFPEATWTCALSCAPAPVHFLEITIRSNWVPGNQWFLHCLHQLFPQFLIYIASEPRKIMGWNFEVRIVEKQIKTFLEKYQN